MTDSPDDDALSQLLRRQATHHVPPEALARRIRAALPADTATSTAAAPWRRWLQALALYGAGALTAWVAASVLLVATPPDTTQDQVMASHVRSLLADHLADIQASSHHQVKPWFAGKLDFSPPVVDLAGDGYALVGGRLDYLDGRAVAALVYRHGAHVVNLFVWPAGSAQPEPPRAATQQGYNLLRWSAAGMRAWAISDMDAAELRDFAERLRAKTAEAPPSNAR